jgi:hypothetical protein
MMEEMLSNVERHLESTLSYDDRRTAEELIKKGYDSQSVAVRLKSNNSFYM